jgi:GT2 family glycosyltransferase
MQVCGVIVTYGDRFNLLSQVINALWKERIDKILIIDNGSSVNTRAGIKKHFPELIVYRFEENKGTAIAFKTGIEKALETACEFIWLMDDDTLPEPDSLNRLKDFWNRFSKIEKEKSTALCSYRKDRPNFTKSISTTNPEEILPLKNNFAGFHIKDFFIKIRERIISNKIEAIESLPASVKINAASYGVLFFHIYLIEKIGLPEESYFLYVDDFDFTYRITNTGGEILMVTSSIIHDLESSFYLPAKKKLLYHSAFDSAKDSSAYYALRNTVYFSKKYLIDNRISYFLNRVLFIIFISVIAVLRGKIHRLKIMRKAMSDGEKGRLGPNKDYKI